MEDNGLDDELISNTRTASAPDDNINNDSCIGSEEFQQFMANFFLDRDYDRFDANQHIHLKQKISYALYGRPRNVPEEYNEEKTKRIQELYNKILEISNTVAEYKDKVEIAFIFNCVEPLEEEKSERKAKIQDYNEKADFRPVPVFVLRKCRASSQPCRIFIDGDGQVYHSWDNYKKNNKLPKCIMLLPKDGRYKLDNKGKVLLEPKISSPECNRWTISDNKDKIGNISIGGVFSTLSFFGLAAVPAGPLMTIGASTVIGCGAYYTGQNYLHLFQQKDQKNLSSGHMYRNLSADPLDYIGYAANLELLQMEKNINAINVHNRLEDTIEEIYAGRNITDESSMLDPLCIAQRRLTVLFFGNTVFNCNTSEESFALKQYNDSLRLNRHRTLFSSIEKEVINEISDVISPVKFLLNRNELFDTLIKNMNNFSSTGIRHSVKEKTIFLNNEQVNTVELVTPNLSDGEIFLSSIISNINQTTELTENEMLLINKIMAELFGNITDDDRNHVKTAVEKVLVGLQETRTLILIAVRSLTDRIAGGIKIWLHNSFSKIMLIFKMIEVVVIFFKNRCSQNSQEYLRTTALPSKEDQQLLRIFEECVQPYFKENVILEEVLIDLEKYFIKWFTQIQLRVQKEQAQLQYQKTFAANSKGYCINCTICGGNYFNVPKNFWLQS